MAVVCPSVCPVPYPNLLKYLALIGLHLFFAFREFLMFVKYFCIAYTLIVV